jgi:hypothetical protein
MTEISETVVIEFVQDVRSGFIDSELMEKYRLSTKALKSLFCRILEEKRMSGAEVYVRPIMLDETIETDLRRGLPRYLLAPLISVREADSPQSKGWIFDLSDKGMRVCGIRSEPGDTKTLILLPRKEQIAPEITVHAECRWFGEEGPEARPVAGFRISAIEAADLRELRNLIRLLTLGLKLNVP